MKFTARRPPPYDHIRPIMISRETHRRVIANNIMLTTPPRSGLCHPNRPATSPALLIAALLALVGLGLLFRGMI